MAEVKRWSVTYTKHMKQKRKVYQDGFLELHTSTNKMLLYDDCEKLLECRISKKDEAVSSGETLTFNAFLVDVNDAESGAGDQRPKPEVNSDGVNFSEKRAKSWNRPQPFQTPAQNIIRGKKPLQNLSPSQNIIREFKKRELHKYGAPLSSPETVKTSTTDWQALYTTQLTQKAKRYHDGFLQLAITGTHGKQIILLDSNRNQLNSRFLKKDEVIASGGSIAFDAHLVDIGEQEGEHKRVVNLHLKENKRNVVGETRIKQEHSNGDITGIDDDKGEENSQNKASLKKAVNSNFSISGVQETKPSRGVPANKLIRDAHQILSFFQNPMAQDTVASRQANSTDKPVSSTKGSEVSDVIMLDFSEDVRPVSVPHHSSVENREPGNNLEIGNKAISSGSSNQLAEGIDIKNFHKLHSHHVKADTTQHTTEFVCDDSRSSSCVSHVTADDEKIVSQEPTTCARKLDCPSFELEGPSFDLGF
ncbi:uncharacterized protein LOC126793584 [Argentina anserina]|uniref:uncharacterized protein LOC126793584 n=1 Tax=Argentina anserina TaxID=57926 RepID=UPI002176595C|nr:uncharacterized protein LOC126793584 [Potentilla anserina]